MKQIITVKGMHCSHCAAAVEQALGKLPDVKKAKADHEQNRAVITVAQPVREQLIREAVESAGFQCAEITLKKGLLG